ncbi:hypothetical protein K505DRAFT_336919 [Melanomma pulvis-pyrius CBS 109.77]|uniref:F-box domain-containing protein n=1 Tax=Melanomma pulvis-pyrius CBS 109.77 TaxID=1314802 RepID=A0A6A6XD18_9PLEO|nr:hypothetical protein K505DRAFT_336919 [Melanomma pulvis-pyrius CBS 109.77]
METASRSPHRALLLPELIHEIIHYLDFYSLIRCQSVSRVFRLVIQRAIESSPAVQKTLFLLADADFDFATASQGTDLSPTFINPYLYRLSYSRRFTATSTNGSLMGMLTLRPAAVAALLRGDEQASWRPMLAWQLPPKKSLSAEPHLDRGEAPDLSGREDGGGVGEESAVKRKGGITLGSLMDLTRHTVREQIQDGLEEYEEKCRYAVTWFLESDPGSVKVSVSLGPGLYA